MDITNINREELVKKFEAARETYLEHNNLIKSEFASVFNQWLAEKGFDGFCTFTPCYDGSGEICIKCDNRSLEIFVDYSKRYALDNTWKYMLTMNYSCGGSFSCDDDFRVKYSVVVGLLAADLKILQEKLDKMDWKRDNDLYHVYSRATEELRSYDIEVAKEEHDRKVAEVLPLIKVGMRVYTGRKNYKDEEIIATVIAMKRKYVDFDFVSKRMTREEIAEKIISGKWEIRA